MSSSQTPLKPDSGQAPAKRQVLVIGSSGLDKTDGPPVLLQYFLGLTGKTKPRVCFLPHASGDAVGETARWNLAVKGLDCEPRVQKIYIASPKAKNFDEELLKADAIYVGGGNALNMLAMWQAHGIDKIMKQAYDRGIVLGGDGAGAICWFEQGLTDSRPGKLTPLDGLGFLKGSLCPDCDADKVRQSLFTEWIKKGEIKEGIAADRGVALHFVDEKLSKVVSAKAQAIRVTREGEKAVQAPLTVELLGK
jgi:peptidase E